jgi:ribonuclease E
MEEEALKENSARVDVHVPVDVATYMLNEKRKAINEIEQQTGIKMVIIANPSLETPQYRVERIRKSEIDEVGSVASYKQIVEVGEQYSPSDFTEKVIQPEQPAVTAIAPSRPAPLPVPQPTGGFLTRIVSLFTGEESKAAKEKKEAETAKKPAARRSSSRGGKPKSQAQTGQGRRRGGRKPGQTQKGGQRSEQQRKPKSAQQSDQQVVEAKSPAQDTTEQSGESKPRSRGRRGGRGRRSSGRQRQADTQQTNESQKPAADSPAEAPAKPVEAQAPKTSTESASKPQDKEAAAVKTEARKSAPAPESKPETVATGE